jgi:protein involved in polysaccharide export with SLBB domain
VDPIVSILPVELTERKATVMGEVFAPGRQLLTPDTRVLDLLAAAQISELGDLDNVILIRNYDSAAPQYRRLELREFLAGESPLQNIYVQEGDVLFVPKTAIARLGFIIDSFFARTRPLFDWYLAGASAVNYNQDRELNRRLNNAAIEAFETGAVPSVP